MKNIGCLDEFNNCKIVKIKLHSIPNENFLGNKNTLDAEYLKKDINTCLKLIKNNNNIEKIKFENQCFRGEESTQNKVIYCKRKYK